jgi:hypothetical protein
MHARGVIRNGQKFASDLVMGTGKLFLREKGDSDKTFRPELNEERRPKSYQTLYGSRTLADQQINV